MKKQYWLDEWERDLVERVLLDVADRADGQIVNSTHAIDSFALRWSRDTARTVAAKFKFRLEP